MARIASDVRRVTVLQAPAGFGKSTALAAVCRRRREQRRVFGWVSVDQTDTAGVLAAHIAVALKQGGLSMSLLSDVDAWSSTPSMHTMGILAGAIEAHPGNCLLILDEVENATSSAMKLIQFLLDRGPGKLHLAMGWRWNPGIDLVTHVLGGTGVVIDVEALRFSRSDAAKLFDDALSRRELDCVMKDTDGWPLALAATQAERASGVNYGGFTSPVTTELLALRLLRGLSDKQRAGLQDLAVFDWLDEPLVDEVLGAGYVDRLLAAAPMLEGLFLRLSKNGRVGRLNQIFARYCRRLLSIENPQRERLLRTRIARALSAQGHILEALQQARAAQAEDVVVEIAGNIGAFRLWLQGGVTLLASVARLMTSASDARSARIALIRCISLRLSQRHSEAQKQLELVARATDGFTRDPTGVCPTELAIDVCFVTMFLAGATIRGLPENPGVLANEWFVPWLEVSDATDGRGGRFLSVARCTRDCVYNYERARFRQSREYGRRAVGALTETCRYGEVFLNTYLGMVDMAAGRVQEAEERYKRVRDLTRKFFSSDACLAVVCDTLIIELDLERYRVKAIEQRTLESLTKLRDVWLEIYLAAVGISADLTGLQQGPEAEVVFLADIVRRVRHAGFEGSFMHAITARFIAALVRARRVDEAQQLWCDAALATAVVALLDLERQSWRSMEMLVTSRARLLAAQGARDAAADVADGLFRIASEHGITRTVVRALALSMEIAELGGRTAHAEAKLVECLRRTRSNGYVGPLILCREVSLAVAKRLVASSVEPELQEALEVLVRHCGEPVGPRPLPLTSRETEVLAALRQGGRNKDIADRLDISEAGVRFHLKNIYRKLGVRGRKQAREHCATRG